MDVEVNDQLPENHNIKCHVCGESKFEEREGFYYCLECGTKQELVRAVEIERDDEFDPDKLKVKKKKIHVEKAEKPQVTSWECYNYILRGFVEELLSFGAKEELKLMALQVWAAYLRRMQVAFFNKKQADLPKLGIKYLPNDAETIYNISKVVRKKRQRRRSENSCTSGNESRSFSKSKRQLDELNYSLTSATSGFSGLTSSTSANSNKAIKLGFNSKARKFLKRKMPVKHLEKHVADSEGLLECHKQPLAREINRNEYNLMVMNIKQIYSILAIALNLIGDDIQLCDLVRFINEKHIGTTNVLQYFPENIANGGKEILKKINFYKSPDKFTEKVLREHIGILRKNIGIHTLNKPDIKKLVQRYIKELCLPTGMVCYIERLINLLPPNFNTRVDGYYPGFEARAMAYVIFTLKLLFGLDGFKEHRISQAAKTLNSKIEQLNSKNNEQQPLLFVWSEWMEYIEMRKVIVSQFNTSFCEQFKQCQSTNQVLDEMADEMRRTEEINNLLNDKPDNPSLLHKLKHIKLILERFQENNKQSEINKTPSFLIEFKPSLTPGLSYMKNILLFCNNEANTNYINFPIPNYMDVDHSQHDIKSFLKVKPLIEYFKNHQMDLKVYVLDTNKNRQQIGIFHAPLVIKKSEMLRKACFDITDEEWDKIVTERAAQSTDDLQFYTDSKSYSEMYHNKINKKRKRKFFNSVMNYDLNSIHGDKSNEAGENAVKENERVPQIKESPKHSVHRGEEVSSNKDTGEDLKSMHSFDIFNENNMDPIDAEDFIRQPRRNLDQIDLFAGISDEESILNVADDDIKMDTSTTNNSDPSILKANDSSFILEEFIKIESDVADFNLSNRNQNQTLESEEIVKMYIANMDCWMLLGCFSKTTNAQRSQLQNKFPHSFNWLLETCAQTIGVEWPAVFEQLICLETMLCLGINDPKTIKNCVYNNSMNPNKELQTIINNSRQIW